MNKFFDITFNGPNVEFDGQGFTGSECETFSQMLKARLNATTSNSEKKPEFYQQVTSQQQEGN